MRIATIMSIAVLGLSGAAIAQVTSTPDQDVPPPVQNDMANNMVTPNDTMTKDMMDNGADDMDSAMPDTVTPTAPDTLDPTLSSTTAQFPDGSPTAPDDPNPTFCPLVTPHDCAKTPARPIRERVRGRKDVCK